MLQSTQASYVAANELKNNIQEVKKNDNYSEEKSYTAYYSDITDWYDKDGKIQMPIVLDENLWQSTPIFSERCELCTIPESVLKEASTEELLQLVISNKLNYLISMYGNVDDGMQRIVKHFNGIREILNRDDCGEVVLDFYNKIRIPSKMMFDITCLETEDSDITEFTDDAINVLQNEKCCEQLDYDANIKYAISISEWILSQENVSSKFSDDQKKVVIESVINKNKEKSNTEYADYIENFFMDKLNAGENTLYEDFYSNYTVVPFTSASGESYVKIYTPAKRTLILTYVNKPTVKTRQQSLTWLGSYTKYLGICVELLDNATDAYNCHSYAWFTMLPGYHNYARQCQLNDATNLTEDSTMKKKSSIVKGSVLYFGSHSVYVEQLKYTCGQAGIVDQILISEKLSNGGPLVKWPWKFSDSYGGSYTCYYYK